MNDSLVDGLQRISEGGALQWHKSAYQEWMKTKKADPSKTQKEKALDVNPFSEMSECGTADCHIDCSVCDDMKRLAFHELVQKRKKRYFPGKKFALNI
jgi:hypothetical protein